VDVYELTDDERGRVDRAVFMARLLVLAPAGESFETHPLSGEPDWVECLNGSVRLFFEGGRLSYAYYESDESVAEMRTSDDGRSYVFEFDRVGRYVHGVEIAADE
jgi:hypothetical protein